MPTNIGSPTYNPQQKVTAMDNNFKKYSIGTKSEKDKTAQEWAENFVLAMLVLLLIAVAVTS